VKTRPPSFDGTTTMAITSVSEISHRAPAPPVSPVASGAAAAPGVKKAAAPMPVHAPAPPPPPPPPAKGFAIDVQMGLHEATNTTTYDFVDPDSGQSLNQIPAEKVLNLVALIIRQLEAEGRR
jgi:hypothetical protein